MPRQCAITGKRTTTGNNVSHSHRKTRRTFRPNLQKKRLWSDSLKQCLRLTVSTKALRLINKIGLDAVLQRTPHLSHKLYPKHKVKPSHGKQEKR